MKLHGSNNQGGITVKMYKEHLLTYIYNFNIFNVFFVFFMYNFRISNAEEMLTC